MSEKRGNENRVGNFKTVKYYPTNQAYCLDLCFKCVYESWDDAQTVSIGGHVNIFILCMCVCVCAKQFMNARHNSTLKLIINAWRINHIKGNKSD